MQNVRAVSFSFIWGLIEDYSTGDSLSDSSEELLRRGGVGGQHICNSGEGARAIKHTAQWKIAASHEEQIFQLMILVLFYEWEDARQWVLKIFSWEYLTIWRPVLTVFPQHRLPHSWSPSWTPFRMCWRPTTAVANDSVLVKLGGEGPSLVGNALLYFWILIDQTIIIPVICCFSY